MKIEKNETIQTVIWKEVLIDEAVGQPHVPATLHFYEDKAVYLIPLDSFKEDEEFIELNKKINELTMSNMTHEYIQAEAEKFAPEYERQIKEPLEQEIERLKIEILQANEHIRLLMKENNF